MYSTLCPPCRCHQGSVFVFVLIFVNFCICISDGANNVFYSVPTLQMSSGLRSGLRPLRTSSAVRGWAPDFRPSSSWCGGLVA